MVGGPFGRFGKRQANKPDDAAAAGGRDTAISYVHVYVCVYIYIYICVHIYIYIYVYTPIYTYVYIEREGDR